MLKQKLAYCWLRLVFPLLLNINVLVVLMLMFLVLIVCLAGVVAAVFHGTLLSLNEIVCRALVSGGVPAVLEPVGECRDDGKRPDGMPLIPWRQGLPLLSVGTLPVLILLLHLMCQLPPEVPAGWQTLQSQPRSTNTLPLISSLC